MVCAVTGACLTVSCHSPAVVSMAEIMWSMRSTL